MKKASGRKITLLLIVAAAICGSVIAASINPAETSPECMPDYMQEHGTNACVSTAKSNEASVEVISPEN